MKALAALTATLGLALAFTSGALLASSRASAPTRMAPTAAATGLARAELAAIVRAELAAVVATSQRATMPGARPLAEAAEVAPTAELDGRADDVAERAARAAEVVDAALARGAWTDADGEQLHDHLVGVPGDEAVAILARRNDAVNRGALQIATTGMPF